MGRPLHNCFVTFAKLLEDVAISVWRPSRNCRTNFEELLDCLGMICGRPLHKCWATLVRVLGDLCITVRRPLHNCSATFACLLDDPTPPSSFESYPQSLSMVSRRTRPRTDHREPSIESMHCFARCVDSKVRTQLCKQIEEQRDSITTFTQKK